MGEKVNLTTGILEQMLVVVDNAVFLRNKLEKNKLFDEFLSSIDVSKHEVFKSEKYIKKVECQYCGRYICINLKSVSGSNPNYNLARILENINRRTNYHLVYLRQLVNLIGKPITFIVLELTFPKSISFYLYSKLKQVYSRKDKLKNRFDTYFIKSQRLNKLVDKFLIELKNLVFDLNDDYELGAIYNLHLHKSNECLKEPHFHFHLLVPCVLVNSKNKEIIVRNDLFIGEDKLKKLKVVWSKILLQKFRKVMNNEERKLLKEGSGVVNYQYLRIKSGVDFNKLKHRLKYSCRKFFYDVLKYFLNTNVTIEIKRSRIEMLKIFAEYQNRIRYVGWLKRYKDEKLFGELYNYQIVYNAKDKECIYIASHTCLLCGNEIEQVEYCFGDKALHELASIFDNIEYHEILKKEFGKVKLLKFEEFVNFYTDLEQEVIIFRSLRDLKVKSNCNLFNELSIC